MFKKLLGIMLAVILAVSPVATFAEGESAVTFPIAENFNDGDISAWTAESGSASFSTDDYGYLKFTAEAEGDTLTRELGIEKGSAFTVDFKIKAERTSGTATVSVGGMKLALDLTNKTLAGKGFIPNLWYNVRVASDGEKADVYLDGANVSAATAIAFENAFEITADQACVIGIDDFKVYDEYLEDNAGMTAEVLNMTFDGFNYENGRTDIEDLKAHYNESSVNGAKAFAIDTESKDMDVHASQGNFGKGSTENSLEMTHPAKDANNKPAGIIHFAFGEESKLYSKDDTQVLSFNVAMDDDEKRELVLRYYTWYYDNGYQRGNAAGVDHTSSSSVVRGKLTQNAGWLINLHNDRIYLFGQNNYYSIVPAMMPNQWNNIRIEITPGDGTTNAFSYSAYINDIAIVEDEVIGTSRFFVRNSSNQEANRGAFFGIHRLNFEYQTSNAYSYGTAGGVWLDDIKLTNYYKCDVPKREASPLLKGDNVLPATNTDMSGDGFDAWEYDKWVTGPVVYVDKNMTLGEYRAHLTSINKNLGVKFRNTDGSDANDTDKISNLKYAEIIKTNYEKMYVSLVGDDTGTLKEHSDDISAIGSSSTIGTFYKGNATLSSITGKGARLSADSSATMAASGSSTPTIRYANHIRRKTIEDDVKDTDTTKETSMDFDLMNKDGYINTATLSKSAALRPVTFEVSVMMPEEFDGYVKIPARYYMALPGAQNDGLQSNMEKTFAIFEGGLITLENRISAIGDKTKASIIGTYNPGEWTHISVTVYPGAASNRVDVRVNGEYANIQNFDVDDETYATIKTEAAKSGTDLRDYPRVNTDAYSRALMLAASNVKLQTIEEFIVYYYGRTGNTAASNIGIDDLKASWGYYKADIPSIAPANKGIIDVLSANTFLAQSGKSVDEIKAALTNSGDVRIYTDDTYANEQTGNVVTNNKIAVQSGAILKYFTINTDNFVIDGNTVKSLARNADDKLYIALYDDSAKLNSVISAKATEAGIISKEVPATIKAFKPFLWNSLLVPYVGTEAITAE